VVTESEDRLLSKWCWWQKQRLKTGIARTFIIDRRDRVRTLTIFFSILKGTLLDHQKQKLDEVGFDWGNYQVYSTAMDKKSLKQQEKSEKREMRPKPAAVKPTEKQPSQQTEKPLERKETRGRKKKVQLVPPPQLPVTKTPPSSKGSKDGNDVSVKKEAKWQMRSHIPLFPSHSSRSSKDTISDIFRYQQITTVPGLQT